MFKIVKDSVLKVSRSLGYDIVPLREMKERDFALHLRELLARLEIDCVLDVGANAGQYHDFLRERVQYAGTIVSFEPLSRHVEALRERSRGDSNWHVEGYALGSSEGSMQINVMVSDQFSSFLEPDHERVGDYAGLNVADHTETVAVRTLDGVLPGLRERFGFTRPYLKIDTQGFDIEVLRGGAKSLPVVKALQTEASVRRRADVWSAPRNSRSVTQPAVSPNTAHAAAPNRIRTRRGHGRMDAGTERSGSRIARCYRPEPKSKGTE